MSAFQLETFTTPATGISVSGLSFRYRATPVLRDVSFEIAAGSFCALLGPNGAGKSTLLSVMAGLVAPESGTVRVAGCDLATDRRTALSRVGLVFQETTLDLDLTIRQNLTYYAAMRGLAGGEARRRIDAALDRLGLADRAHERARQLNGGHRRRTEIARALLHDPDVLIVDEPTVGLDPASRSSIADHVHDLCAEASLTALWATHLVDEVRPDDMLVILHQGQVLASDTASAVADAGTLSDTFMSMTSQAA